jgi:hypothetical protein
VEKLGRAWVGEFFVGSMVFGIVEQWGNRGLGVEAFCFSPKQLFSNCSAIERH